MKKLEIEIPVDKEVDWETSAKQKQIVLKDKQPIYEDICKELFKENYFYITNYGTILHNGTIDVHIYESNNAITRHQLECILAKNKLVNVAICLNNGWKPNLEKDYGVSIALTWNGNLIIDTCIVLGPYSSGKVLFKCKELAQQAIKILGEETIKLALEPLY